MTPLLSHFSRWSIRVPPAGAVLLLVPLVVAGCGSPTSVPVPATPTATTHTVSLPPCKRTLTSFVDLPVQTTPGFLPHGFRLESGNPNDSGNQPLTYETKGPRARPYVEIRITSTRKPLGPTLFGRSGTVSTRIQGYPALLNTAIAPFAAVDWKPDADLLVSVETWGEPSQVLLHIARTLSVGAGGIVRLPVKPGPIVSRSRARSLSLRLLRAKGSKATTKLTTWTELQGNLQSAVSNGRTYPGPTVLSKVPWLPLWAVLVREVAAGAPYSVPPSSPYTLALVVVTDSGRVLRLPLEGRLKNVPLYPSPWIPPWFRALTDRDPSRAGCPGGSSSRLPFGVPTRNEEAYIQRFTSSTTPNGDRNVRVLKLTTVKILSRHGLCGGPGEDCTLDSLAWPSIDYTIAPLHHLLQCPPPWVSVHAGYKYPRVRFEFGISYGGNSESGCTRLPKWARTLKDLAPPLH